jgi:hypothetical protein
MAFQEMVDADVKDLSEERKVQKKSELTTSHSLIIKTESALNDNLEIFLPNYSRELPFSFPTTEIFDIFLVSSGKKRFQVIERTPSMATAVYKERYSLKSVLLCCLNSEQRPRQILSAVRLLLSLNESTCKRTVHIKGIYGLPQVLLPLITDFRTRLDDYLKTSKLQPETYENFINEEEETVMTCKHESSSYYQFHKILSSEAYTLGKSISDFISAFSEQYRNAEESVSMMPLPLTSVKETIDHTVEALFTHYNNGRVNSERMMMFCRPAVEKYIFSKIYSVLFPIYTQKWLSCDEKVNELRQMTSKWTDSDLFDTLMIGNELRPSEVFNEAVDMLDRVEDQKSPSEKVSSLASLVGALKVWIIEATQSDSATHELEFRLLSFVILRSSLKTPAAECELVRDFLGSKFSDSPEVQVFCSSVQFLICELVV